MKKKGYRLVFFFLSILNKNEVREKERGDGKERTTKETFKRARAACYLSVSSYKREKKRRQ